MEECQAEKSQTSTASWWILSEKVGECEMRHAVLAEIHVYNFRKRCSFSRYLLSHVWNIVYRIKKLLEDVIENFSWLKNCYVMSKNKKSSWRWGDPWNVMRLLASRNGRIRIRIPMLFLHLKPCAVVYSQEMSRICNWEHIWSTKGTISQLRDENYAELSWEWHCLLHERFIFTEWKAMKRLEKPWND